MMQEESHRNGGIDKWRSAYPTLINSVFGVAAVLISIAYLLPWVWRLFDEPESGELRNVEARVIKYAELSAPPPIEVREPIDKTESAKPKVKTVKFLEPVVKPDEEVLDTNELPTVDELREVNPGLTNIDGSDSIVLDMPVEAPKIDTIVEEPKVYTFVEKQPSFPGGLEALYAYLNDNLEYPPRARENKVSGTVIVQFIVEEDGSISDLQIARSVSKELDEEALRVLGQMPNWEAGLMNRQQVRVRFTLPVRFKIIEQ